jgi:L-gulonate 3-dehydrogenase
MSEIGQSPVTLKKETNGFILNRLQYALIMEAWRLVEVNTTGSDTNLLK